MVRLLSDADTAATADNADSGGTALGEASGPSIPVHPVYADQPTTVFEVMSRLSLEHQAINLGQGFPDGGFPADVVAQAAEALTAGSNQYPSLYGVPALRQAVARHERRFYGLAVDWQSEVLVTSGATEALAASLLALVRPGDEVVLFEPFYDAYLPMVRRAGGVPRFVTLHPPDWRLSRAALEAAVGPDTAVVLLNNPLNPAGHVFGADELADLAAVVRSSRAVVLADEVYEHIVFDGRRHIPAISLPGLAERTVKVGSAGKTFSLTGWKVGLVVASPPLMQAVAKAHQFLTFTTPPNLQTAVAHGLGKEDGYFHGLAHDLAVKRDRFSRGLADLGYRVLRAEGAYFVNIDVTESDVPGDDTAWCRWLVETAGVAAIPLSAFHARPPARRLVRFCFAKDDRVLDAALDRLARVAPGRRPPRDAGRNVKLRISH